MAGGCIQWPLAWPSRAKAGIRDFEICIVTTRLGRDYR